MIEILQLPLINYEQLINNSVPLRSTYYHY